MIEKLTVFLTKNEREKRDFRSLDTLAILNSVSFAKEN